MNTDTHLTRALAIAAYELRAQTPPAPLLPAIHRHLTRTTHAPRLSWLGWTGVSTAAVAVAVMLVVGAIVASEPAQIDKVETVAGSDGFVRLVNADEWNRANAQAGRTWLVSAELPQARLAALGLPYDPGRAGERVPAELLIHSSGEVLAVRVSR